MRTRLAPLMLLLAAACSPVIANTDDKGDATGGDDVGEGEGEGEGDGEDTDGADPDEDEEEVDPGPTTADWAGEWFAFVDLEADTEGGWGDQEIGCSGEMIFEFDEDGDVQGAGMCSVSGWAEAELWFEGEVDEDGNLDGVLVFSQEWIGESELDVEGSASDESAIDTDVEGTLVMGGWGGDYEVPLFGEMSLERE